MERGNAREDDGSQQSRPPLALFEVNVTRGRVPPLAISRFFSLDGDALTNLHKLPPVRCARLSISVLEAMVVGHFDAQQDNLPNIFRCYVFDA